MGGKFDKSFNQGVYDGVERFKQETGTEYREFEVTNETQREQAIRRMAQRGADPILGIGFAQAGPLEAVAKDFPDTRFTLIDGIVDLPNVQSVVFKEHEGSFLVGVLAALASDSDMGRLRGRHGHPADPTLRLRLRAGRQARRCLGRCGAEHDRHPRRRPGTIRGASSELAKGQFDRGVDVIYAGRRRHRCGRLSSGRG